MIITGDCLEVMAGMEASSVDLIVTDPPYFKVKGEPWDHQWDTPCEFLRWLDRVVEQWARLLRPNGSLYCFASPQMAARVECLIAERMNVLNHIVWDKPGPVHALKYGGDRFRQYVQKSERIIFAEHYGADNMAKGEAGYVAKCDELRGFVFEPLRAYLAGEFERAGMLNSGGKIAANVACGFSASAGGMASRHYFGTSQWQLPTREHYFAMRDLLNANGGDYLRREYEDLRREYEDLRREYEDLRREYEDLRRPFSVSPDVPYTDVWTFEPVRAYKGKHPCEKPRDMLRHIIEASSRPGAVVLDSFTGTGSTGIACGEDRKFIGIELSEKYSEIARARVSHARGPLFGAE